jgi:Ca2+-binding EF-hand superfamily protein
METFKQIDDDNNGYIDAEEFSILINQLTSNDVTLEMAKEQAAQTIKEIDTDGDGHIDFEEFKAWYLQSETRVITDVHNAFNALDETHNGMIEMKDLRKVVDQMGMSEFLDDNQIVEALTYFKNKEDPEHPNKITFDNFREWYKKKYAVGETGRNGTRRCGSRRGRGSNRIGVAEHFQGALELHHLGPHYGAVILHYPRLSRRKIQNVFPCNFCLSNNLGCYIQLPYGVVGNGNR